MTVTVRDARRHLRELQERGWLVAYGVESRRRCWAAAEHDAHGNVFVVSDVSMRDAIQRLVEAVGRRIEADEFGAPDPW